MGQVGTKYIFLFFLFSFLGWSLEVCYAFYKEKRFVNRGFLKGPLCPLYGFGMVGILSISRLIMKHMPEKSGALSIILIFFWAFLFSSLLEYLTGLILESVFHQKWWDYSEEKWNLKGRICLKFSLIWGVLGVVIIEFLNLLPGRIEDRVPFFVMERILYVALPIFIIDVFTSIDLAFRLKSLLVEIEKRSEELKEKIEDTAFETLSELKLKKEEKREMVLYMKQNVAVKAAQLEERFSIQKASAALFILEFRLKMRERALEAEESLGKKGDEILAQAEKYQRWFRAFPHMGSAKGAKAFKEIRKKMRW